MNAGTIARIEGLIGQAAEAVGSLDHPACFWLARISDELQVESRGRAHRAADRAVERQLEANARRRQRARLTLIRGGLLP